MTGAEWVVPPGSVLLFGALLLPLLRGMALRAGVLALPLLSYAHLLWGFDLGTTVEWTTLAGTMTPVRIDRLSMVWGHVFHIAAFLASLFALQVDDRLEHWAGLSYAGAAIGAVFAGDLLTLFVFWELTAVTSVWLVWASRTDSSYSAGMRYLIIQVTSGVLLLAGIIFRLAQGGDLAFGHMGLDGSLATSLIFLAFGIKACFPLLHSWLQDAYPEATPSGTVFLSSFTTKLAIYALARSFAGTSSLLWIGAAMTLFPIFYAVIVNDLRKVLAYSLNNQLGYMVVGIGIGTPLALNGTAAHAFAHILYKGLLFMAMGAVLHRTGTAKGSELGGLYKSMPLTALFCMVGAAAISGFPLFSGFVTKSMIVSATGHEGLSIIYLVLLFASAGVFHHSGIKIPYFAFFAHDSGKRPEEAPWNMLLAMGLASAMCVLLGVYPAALYSILPYPADYVPYTWDHVVGQMQLLLGSALAFGMLNRIGAYPPELRSTVLDVDWIYRRWLPAVIPPVGAWLMAVWLGLMGWLTGLVRGLVVRVHGLAGPGGAWSRGVSTGEGVLAASVLLTLYALLYFDLGDPTLTGLSHDAPHHSGASHHAPASDEHGALPPPDQAPGAHEPAPPAGHGGH